MCNSVLIAKSKEEMKALVGNFDKLNSEEMEDVENSKTKKKKVR